MAALVRCTGSCSCDSGNSSYGGLFSLACPLPLSLRRRREAGKGKPAYEAPLKEVVHGDTHPDQGLPKQAASRPSAGKARLSPTKQGTRLPMSASRMSGVKEVRSAISKYYKRGDPDSSDIEVQSTLASVNVAKYKDAVDELSTALSGVESDKLLISDTIGQGSFGKVWRAQWRGLVSGLGVEEGWGWRRQQRWVPDGASLAPGMCGRKRTCMQMNKWIPVTGHTSAHATYSLCTALGCVLLPPLPSLFPLWVLRPTMKHLLLPI